MIENKKKNTKYKKSKYLTGEDIDMLNERKYSSYKKKNICDTHEDGA